MSLERGFSATTLAHFREGWVVDDFDVSITRIEGGTPRQVGLIVHLPDGTNILKGLENDHASRLIQQLQECLDWAEGRS